MSEFEKELVQHLEERFRFEKMLAEMSAHFINCDLNQIDAAIELAQEKICESLDFDRSIVWRALPESPQKMEMLHIYQPTGGNIEEGPLDVAVSFPWLINQVMLGKTVRLKSLKDLPAEAGRDLESLKEWGVRSVIVMPLMIGDKFIGALSFARLRDVGVWKEELIQRLQVVAHLIINVLARKRAEQSLLDQLEFETLLTEISARFINLPAEQIDSQIEEAQKIVCQRIGVDLSAMLQWSEKNPRRLMITHLYSPPEGPSRPEWINAEDDFPWQFSKVMRGETLTVITSKMPPEALRDQETRRHFGVKSSVVIPLSAGGGPLIGVLSFDSLRSERQWSKAIVKKLEIVARIFTTALLRKNTELHLRESESRLSMATDGAGVGLWVIYIDTGHFWVNSRGREIFGCEEDEDLSEEKFFRAIHEADRGQVMDAVKDAIRSGEEIKIDYRVALPQQEVRWVSFNGKRSLSSTGKPLSLMGFALDITERKNMEVELRLRLNEIEALKKKLERENLHLRKEIKLQGLPDESISRSAGMRRALSQAEQVARTSSSVLIWGETGTGKELLARTIYKLSDRCDRPLVTVNCASLPPTLVESELFGREKGAYTGALTKMIGRFELADGGTLFLDEIGEMPLGLQAKLLRVLEEGRFERLGSSRSIQVDVRIIAATNRDLARLVTEGAFRRDLYFRLNVFPIFIPPLRERPDDIAPLVWFFVRLNEGKMGKRVDHIPPESMRALQRYSWPGNVRELKNAVERAMILCSGRTLDVRPTESTLKAAVDLTLQGTERQHILNVLEQTGWRISGRAGAAEILGLKRTTLQSKIKKLGIQRSTL